ncbi:glycogen debranching protein [Nocardioides sp. GY 10127]|nr:glycogen debranching protein [Nocardioides sp. GY 10127]
MPFAHRGSWINLSPVVGTHSVSDTLHLVSHVNGLHAVLALRPEMGGRPADLRWEADPAELRWVHRDGRGPTVRAAFDGAETLRLRGRGDTALRLADPAGTLTPFTGTYLFDDPVDDAPVFTSYETGRRYRVTVLEGACETVGAGNLGQTPRSVLLGGDGQPWEVAVEELTSRRAGYRAQAPFEEVVSTAAAAFGAYLDAVAPWRSEATPAAARAAYVLWSATVAPGGYLAREAVLMSKHWMDKVWSWDHCFNALALAPGLPDEALDQFLLPFDHQDESGALPDSVTHSEVLHNYVKPPIHGWALARLRATAGRPLTRQELEGVHDRLGAWTRFWLDHRRVPGRAVPHYHHGNDSGWDNSTTFDRERVVESPDLAAFLVLQLDVLAGLAEELGRPAAEWARERDDVLRALLEELWTGEAFVARGARDGRSSSTSSLLNALPVVLGERLPEGARDVLVAAVKGHLTPWGPATEPLDSPLYEDDGYWRGPIWAPSTALIEDGLRRCGEIALADEVSARFRRLCEASGFAENFDARTGEGLRDRAYTWTAAVYLTLAADHERRRAVQGPG